MFLGSTPSGARTPIAQSVEPAEAVSVTEFIRIIRLSGSKEPRDAAEWKELTQSAATKFFKRKQERTAELGKLGIANPENVVADCNDLARCRVVVMAQFMTPFAAEPGLEAAVSEADNVTTKVLGHFRSDTCGPAIAADRSQFHQSLLCRYRRDQAIRQVLLAPPATNGATSRTAVLALLFDLMVRNDINNTAWLEQNVQRYGWPVKGIASADIAEAAWVIAQHSDRNQPFQVRTLRRLEDLMAKEQVEGKHYAYLYDRVWGEVAGKQRFGTQWVCKDGKNTLQPLEDAESVTRWRKQVGLGPIVPPKFSACSTL
jgi:hypothetical protein